MPRLVNRGNAFAGPPSLPDYQPQACPLSDSARRALTDLASNRGHALYEAQLKDCLRQLGVSVRDLNERLCDQRERLEALRARRQQRGSEVSDEERRLEEHLASFSTHVDDLTRRSERAVRDCIDKRTELEDEAAVLDKVCNEAATRPPPPADEDDETKPPPVTSTLETFRKRKAEKLDDYTNNLSPYQRYARNNDYAAFKKSWHDAAAGKDGPPLPDASKWFRSDGQPVMDRPDAAADDAGDGRDGEDDDDDDIAVAREVISINCPLTLCPMVEPYSNNKCKHTFEKAAIRDYLSGQGALQCPQTGCSQMFSRADFDSDFYLDQAMLRRIQRGQETRRNHDLEDDDDDDE
ncbi:hypothetical protein CDD80_3576 [Ophiocordyceps camponoti-rufipedis]|uniref:SP-RING-type domain-containing protein n=1 Tax=Ophiocordyceps camponoti-rufipedis TaxID=2004952 RepID=A0A2C5Z266_9HYPO|nr:hypothetical protein CDD80_3576 [Ophiocordyceps camponoti-rufipedis]